VRTKDTLQQYNNTLESPAQVQRCPLKSPDLRKSKIEYAFIFAFMNLHFIKKSGENNYFLIETYFPNA
jgi:hypothetical protein